MLIREVKYDQCCSGDFTLLVIHAFITVGIKPGSGYPLLFYKVMCEICTCFIFTAG